MSPVNNRNNDDDDDQVLSNDHEDNDNDDDDNDDNDNDDGQISLEWLEKKFGRMLEIFLIIQFSLGICLFFTGIFFLVWAVASTATLQAGSYMLLAFFIIGRALLGIIGYYTENFCLLFSYGVILLATFVFRTIIMMIRLKIMVSPDHQLPIPPLLQAAPGAMSTYIELILAIFECLQVFVTFYLCWLWTKKRSISREEDETKLTLNIANEVARYLHRKELSMIQNRKKSSIFIDNTDSNEKTSNDNNVVEKRRKSSAIDMRKQSIMIDQQQQQQNTNVNTNVINNPSSSLLPQSSIPLKSILHQPNITTSINRQQQQHQESTSTTQTHQQPFNAIHEYHHQCPINRQYSLTVPPPNYQQQQQPIGGYHHNLQADNHPLYGSTLRSTAIEHEYYEPTPILFDVAADEYVDDDDDDDKELRELEDFNNNNNNNNYGRIGDCSRIPSQMFYRNYQNNDDDDDYNDRLSLPPSRVRSPVPPYEQYNHSPLLYERMDKIHQHYRYQNYGSTNNYDDEMMVDNHPHHHR
ncbi:uncharacterized protein LOC113792253 [Dermatophagoides pteronyssinus]|uniref:uncharacterized protein LOC113792253 n=1 Tax=Dermatophagoides pteronyssinus TaxID=6956 RepID=UPI003F679058